MCYYNNILYYITILIVTNCKYIILFMLYYSCLWEIYIYKVQKRKEELIMTDLKQLSYSQRKVNQLVKDTNEDLKTLLDEMSKNISDNNKSELIEDTKYYIADTLRRLEILQSQLYSLNKEDVIICNRLMAIVNHTIKTVKN